MHQQVVTLNDADAWLNAFFAQKRAENPKTAAEVEALDTPAERKRLIQGAKVGAIRKAPGEVLTLLASRGLIVLRISAPDQRFAIGSFPIVRNTKSLRSPQSEAWLPIAPDVAVGFGGPIGEEAVATLEDPARIWLFNRKMAQQSATFASSSKALMEALIAALPGDALPSI